MTNGLERIEQLPEPPEGGSLPELWVYIQKLYKKLQEAQTGRLADFDILKLRNTSWVDVRAYGVKGDGTTDDTVAIRAVMNSGANFIKFPKATYAMSGPFELVSNVYIEIEPGTIFSKLSDGDNVGWWKLFDISNVIISGYEVEWKYATKPTSDEHRHIFDIRGASNIHILGAAANDSGGDGFYVGATGTQPFCENIVLRDISANNNRRQGLSIISAKHLKVINPRLTNTTGTSPAAGCDIEPNSNDNFLEDVVIENPYTEGNDGWGITVYINSLAGVVDKEVTIRIINPIDKHSVGGLQVNALDLDGNTINGNIIIKNLVSIEPDLSAFTARNYDRDGPRIELHSPLTIRPNEGNNGSLKFGSAFIVYREPGDTGAAAIGNVHFFNPEIKDNRAIPRVKNYFYIQDLTGADVQNVTIDGQITGEGIVNPALMVDFYGTGRVEDLSQLITHDMTNASFTLAESIYLRLVHNLSNTATKIVTLSDDIPAGWPDVTFEVRVAQTLRIDPAANSTIVPFGTGAGKYLQSSTIGHRITLRRTSATQWKVVDIVGAWTAE